MSTPEQPETIHRLCQSCLKECKQSEKILSLKCPNYENDGTIDERVISIRPMSKK